MLFAVVSVSIKRMFTSTHNLSENKPKKEIIQMLKRRGYDSDPVKAWKESQDKLQVRYPAIIVMCHNASLLFM